jgi:LEA14-like dessication related protein
LRRAAGCANNDPAMTTRRTLILLSLAALTPLGGCALLEPREPVQVSVVGVEPLVGQGLEMRLLVRLRVLNPNDRPLEYSGVFVRMDVEGQRFATGVSGQPGSVPRYGEALVELPVSISAFDIARQALRVAGGGSTGKLAYELSGRLDGPGLRAMRFDSRGELALPAGFLDGGQPPPRQ